MRYLIAVTGVAAVSSMAWAQCSPDWHVGTLGDPGMTTNTGRTGVVNRMVLFDDGTGEALYASGVFSSASGTMAEGVAKWDGSRWSPLGDGFPGVRVTAMAVFDDGTGEALYVGGNFLLAGSTQANAVAKWDGNEWTAVGDGLTRSSGLAAAFTMAVFDDGSGPALWVGGSFDMAGGQPAVNIAKWDGHSWLNAGDSDGTVNTLFVWDDGTGEALYAGGNILVIGNEAANGIAKRVGQRWSPLGGGVVGGLGRVNAIAAYDDGNGEELYAGGRFDFAGGVAADNIAKWDGTSWSRIPFGGATLSGGSMFSVPVSVMATYDDGVNGEGLYVGGSMDGAGGLQVNQIARLDGTGWSDVGGGVANPGSVPTVSAMIVHDDGAGFGETLFVGGGFVQAGAQTAGSIARWGGCFTSCYADCDGNEVLDIFDFLCFQDAFTVGDPYANCDGNAVLDIFDFLCFQDEFVAGCP